MPISYISGNSISGTTTLTLPAHQAGDVILMFAYRVGSTTAPTVPAGWTTISTGSGGGGSSNASAVAYKVAASSSETSGTWTGAGHLIATVYRGCQQSAPIGGNGVATGSGTVITYPAVTMSRSNGSSWVVGMAGHRSNNVSIQTPPTGMTNRDFELTASGGLSAVHSTTTGVTSWSATTVSAGGTASNWIGRTVELLDQPTKRVILCT